VLAPTHPRQPERLSALRSYDILDTPREADFDDIVKLASDICGTPISVVNLIDQDRQWFKAETGLGVRETPLETSLCSHAILESDFVEIGDTLNDCRMQDNALCTGEPGLRFYAGALLQTKDGLPLGTLCVLDYEPRVLSALQRQTLHVLARQVMAQLDLRLGLRRQALLQREMDHRVRNSLASVARLLRLQFTHAKDPALRSAVNDVGQRIRTISLLHEELYREGAMDDVNLASYLRTLRGMLQGSAPQGVTIDVNANAMIVDSKRASSIGIIMSEFAMNSCKHAFADGGMGRITFALRRAGDGAAEFLCADDGAGGAKGNGKPGLGMRLMHASASQIGGELQILNSAPGYAMRVMFPC
jgi:two-component sensor histidine kinase